MDKMFSQYQLNDVAVILPSLDPDERFTGVVDGLLNNGFSKIVIVDDGSSAENQKYFEMADEHAECHVIHHGVNKGKGRALKTAFSYLIESVPEIKGAVTIDGDGQHLSEDIAKCCQVMLDNQDKVVLGCRDFDLPGVPPRSVAGNKFTSRMFRLLFGINISDTQTGLRAFPREYFQLLTDIDGERFEYETNVLLQLNAKGIRFIEQPITTVYDKENYSSHYNAFKDSYKVGKIMFKYLMTTSGIRYVISSVFSWLLDNGLFALLFSLLSSTVPAQIIARVFSSFFNFNMNKLYAFRKKGNYLNECVKYYCLCIPQTAVSVALLYLVVSALGVTAPFIATLLKIVIEIILYIISYFIQKKWVFM